MVSTTRRIVAMVALASGSALVLAGWLTGFFARVTADAGRIWDRLLAWVHAPLDLEHVAAAAATVLISLVLFFVVIAILSDD
ncbi:hypothetical protein ACI2LF_24465 [Kribbella sp. NPDC020789]